MPHSSCQPRCPSLVAVLLTILLQSYAQAQASPTAVEDSPALPAPPRGTLATGNYRPTQKEAAFFSKLKRDEQTNGSMLGSYSITGKKGVYVGRWNRAKDR